MIVVREKKSEIKTAGKEKNNDIEKQRGVGFAVDIGTTTIAMSILNLTNGMIIDELAETNKQTTLGADVMMRIMHAIRGNAGKLHDIVIDQIQNMADNLLKKNDINLEKKEISFLIVGNTTMCHLFLGKNVDGLAGFPFRSSYQNNYICFGKEIGMDSFEESKITVLSGIYAHVGSDALAVIGAEKLYENKGIQLAVDFGTNAEIILNRNGKLYVCSTAAGPALEGKGIQCGMRAQKGAIKNIKISPQNGNIILEVIDTDVPKGICGSGLLDGIAQLKNSGLVQEDGYMLGKGEAKEKQIPQSLCDLLIDTKGEHTFLLYDNKDSHRKIMITQKDIRNVQLAKSAIQAGICCILEEANISIDDVDHFIIAGVLGNHISKRNAQSIGLFPMLPEDRYILAGNAAQKGAMECLLNQKMSQRLEKISTQIEHVELAQKQHFSEMLINSMSLEAW